MGWLFDDEPMGDGTLGDGTRAISYRELAARGAALVAAVAAAGIRHEERVAIACDGHLGAAVGLLGCLDAGLNVALVPAATTVDLPRDCRAIIRVDLNDDAGLSITANPRYLAAPLEKGVVVSTSGSTGRPKRALYRHGALLTNARACLDRLGLARSDRVAIPVPILHMYGLGAAFLPAVLARASIDLQPGANVMRFVARERAFEPNVAFLTPSFAQGLLAARRGDRAYRFSVVAGDRMPTGAFERYEARFGTLVALYGTTELGAVAASSPGDAFETRASSAGTALAGVRLSLREEASRDARELDVQRRDRFAGYLDDDGRLVEASDLEAPWATHDHAEIGPAGHLRLLGRADDAVNRDGVLVRLPDLEARLVDLEGVARAIVVPSGATIRGDGLVACVVAQVGVTLEPGTLRVLAARLLPSYAVPDRFVILDELPLLPSDKIDRQALRSTFA